MNYESYNPNVRELVDQASIWRKLASMTQSCYVRELMNRARESGTKVKIWACIEGLGIPAEKFREINDPEDLRKMLEESDLRPGDYLHLSIRTLARYGKPEHIHAKVCYKLGNNGKWELDSETFPTEGDYVGGSPPGWLGGVSDNEKVINFIEKYGANIKPGTDMGALKPLVEDW